MKRSTASAPRGAILLLTTVLLLLGLGCDADQAPSPADGEPTGTESSPRVDPQAKAAERLRSILTPAPEPVLAEGLVDSVAFLAVETSTDQSQEIVAFDASGGRLGPLTSDKRIKLELTYSPASRRIAYVARYEKDPDRFDVVAMDLDGGNGVNLTLEFPSPEEGLAVMQTGVGKRMVPNRYPSFGPGGDEVYFAQRKESVWSLHVTDARKAARPRLLFEGPADEGGRRRSQLFDHPEVSPDGKLIACVQRTIGIPESVGLVDLASAGGEPVFKARLGFELGDRIEYPRFSPDGKSLLHLVQKMREGSSEIWVRPVEAVVRGEHEGQMIFAGPTSLVAKWARAGEAILMAADLGQGELLYLIDLEGEDRAPRSLGSSTLPLRSPVWIER